jgi:ornithine carbamoyltransferase
MFSPRRSAVLKRDFLRIVDLSTAELQRLLVRADELKRLYAEGRTVTPMAGKSLIMLFEKSSTRTRVSFEIGAQQLGGRAVFLSSADCQIGRGEPIRDTARVLSRYGQILMVRTFAHDNVEEMARYATVPVINGLSDAHHPCQILADLLTVMERREAWADLKYAWLGDGNNVANSWIEAAGRLRLHLSLAVPPGYEPDPTVVTAARAEGARIDIVHDAAAAVDGAGVVMTDVWTSMGQEDEKGARDKVFEPFRLDGALLASAAPDALVLHCLPAHRGEEITDDVMESGQSVVFDQAENRLHAQKALMEFLLQATSRETL